MIPGDHRSLVAADPSRRRPTPGATVSSLMNEENGERTERARLRWRCRRGTRELDTLLVGFFDQRYESLSKSDKRLFSQLLELPDPDLHDYLLGWYEAADPPMARLLERIRGL